MTTATETEAKPELTQAQKIERMWDALPPIFRDVVPDVEMIPRFDLTLPWVADGRCYASDGRIIVAVQATEEIAALVAEAKPIRGRLPNALDVWSDPGLYSPAPVAIPEAEAFMICPECQGFGRVADASYPASWFCEDCDGSGRGLSYEPIVIDRDMTIGSHFAAILNRHEAKAYLPLVPNTATLTVPLAFTCEHGVSGRLMPMTGA